MDMMTEYVGFSSVRIAAAMEFMEQYSRRPEQLGRMERDQYDAVRPGQSMARSLLQRSAEPFTEQCE
jgi:hypothetical protein